VPTEIRDQPKLDADERALWERPAFRRLVANNAEGGTGPLDDGNCVGGNANNHSFCL
jgi:hypothetical protein